MHVGPIFRWSTVLDARRPNLSMVYIQCLMVVINIVFTIIMVIVIRGSGRQCPFYKLYHYISSLLNVTLLSKMGHTDTVCDFFRYLYHGRERSILFEMIKIGSLVLLL